MPSHWALEAERAVWRDGFRGRRNEQEVIVSHPVSASKIAASTPPGELGAIAAEVEQFGYGELWLAEDYFELGGIS